MDVLFDPIILFQKGNIPKEDKIIYILSIVQEKKMKPSKYA